MLIRRVFVFAIILLVVQARRGVRSKWPSRNGKTNYPTRRSLYLDWKVYPHYESPEYINHRTRPDDRIDRIETNSTFMKSGQDFGLDQRYSDGLDGLSISEIQGDFSKTNPSDQIFRNGLRKSQWTEESLVPSRNSKTMLSVKGGFPSATVNEEAVKYELPKLSTKRKFSEYNAHQEYISFDGRNGIDFPLRNTPISENIQRGISKKVETDAYPVMYGSGYLSSVDENPKYPVTWYDSSQSNINFNYQIPPVVEQPKIGSELAQSVKTDSELSLPQNPISIPTELDLMEQVIGILQDENPRTGYDGKYHEINKIDTDFEHLPINTEALESNSIPKEESDYDFKIFNYTNLDSFNISEDLNTSEHVNFPTAQKHPNGGVLDEEYIIVRDNDFPSAPGVNGSYTVAAIHNTEEPLTSSDTPLLDDLLRHENTLDLSPGLEETVHFDTKSTDLFQEPLKDNFILPVVHSRSLIFNPVARPTDRFQDCRTSRNETGSCRYVQHCLLPNIIGSMYHFLEYVCIIQQRYIGVCCPDFPVHSLFVTWPHLDSDLLKGNNSIIPTQPKDGCGISSKTRIVGGNKADLKEWPWMAALISSADGQFFCGGSLINSLYVLTAAHCTFSVPRNRIVVRLGEYDFKTSEEGPGEDYHVIEIKRHAQFSRRSLRNDIALLKLAEPANFGPFISTLCLPEVAADGLAGEMATLAGWGHIRGGGPSSNILMEASFPVWSNKECASVHGIRIPDRFLCAGAKDKGACNGDSGGPLMILDEKSKRWKGIGIVSWGRQRCNPNFPTVFTRVFHYLDWIEAHST